MKIEDLAYRVCTETLNLLEEKYHYRVSDEHKKNIQKEIKENINRFIAESSKSAAVKD